MSLTKVSYSMINGAPVNVSDYGVTTAQINAALTAAANGTIVFQPITYTLTSALIVPDNTTVDLNGATLDASGGSFSAFTLGSNCTIFNGSIVGPGNTSYSANSTGISCVGTRNAPSAPTYVTGPTIENVSITEMGEYGIYLQYCDTASVTNCSIDGIGYSGIGMLSCKNCVIDGNYINDISPGVGSNCYGVFMTQQTDTVST